MRFSDGVILTVMTSAIFSCGASVLAQADPGGKSPWKPGYYRFEEGQGLDVIDSLSGDLHGTIEGVREGVLARRGV